VEKYRNKVLYRYDLREFRNDRFSKDVYIVQSDFEERDRIIQAMILSQYKQEVAAKNRIFLKPVILFKAQKTIEQSRQNKTNYHKLVERLSIQDIVRVRRKSDIPLIQRAFKFFDDNGITDEQLANRLRAEFDEGRCISVNEEKEKANQQLLLNSLEDKDNSIRAIFAVQKLNEGWDVLNLFDIVRCYTARDSKGGRPGKTTISEAQLIGRGARYFPFNTKDNTDRFRRKYDGDLGNELRVLEEMHYHSINDSRYISELRTALIEEGMLDEREVERPLLLKDSFKKSKFFKKGLIYINERIKNTFENIKSFSDLGVRKKNYLHSIATGRGATGALLDKDLKNGVVKEAGRKDVPVESIGLHIKQNAIAHNPFYTFESLKRFSPHLSSKREFITSKSYIGGLEITFQGDESELNNLSNQEKLLAMNGLLSQIETEIKKNMIEFRGTRDFKPNNIDQIFYNKVLKLSSDSERTKGDEEFVEKKDWYVFNANYGTSEEKAFVRMLDRQIEKLREKYNGIYLIRNERFFKIYNFSDGQAFEPDFVLFLKEKDGNLITYQLFIEPKGKHLKEHDEWKKEFLKEIADHFREKIIKFSEKDKYRIIGIPFYNNEDENQFKESLFSSIEN
jgi:type III restriction enzyme